MCGKKGVSPYLKGDWPHTYRDCRYCGAFKTRDAATSEWSEWRNADAVAAAIAKVDQAEAAWIAAKRDLAKVMGQ
jgi:hypothetical protein